MTLKSKFAKFHAPVVKSILKTKTKISFRFFQFCNEFELNWNAGSGNYTTQLNIN